jgi:hypothetical protein
MMMDRYSRQLWPDVDFYLCRKRDVNAKKGTYVDIPLKKV